MSSQKHPLIYFTASLVGKTQFESHYHQIVNYLKSKQYEVMADHIFQASPQQVDSATRSERLAFHEKLEKWISSCGMMVVEASFPSMSVGYEVSLALHQGKPIIILYTQEVAPALFAYHHSELITCEKYDHVSLPGILDDFIAYTQGLQDTRFTFFLSHKLSTYLDKKSSEHNLPKSVYVRRLIEEDMKKAH